MWSFESACAHGTNRPKNYINKKGIPRTGTVCCAKTYACALFASAPFVRGAFYCKPSAPEDFVTWIPSLPNSAVRLDKANQSAGRKFVTSRARGTGVAPVSHVYVPGRVFGGKTPESRGERAVFPRKKQRGRKRPRGTRGGKSWRERDLGPRARPPLPLSRPLPSGGYPESMGAPPRDWNPPRTH